MTKMIVVIDDSGRPLVIVRATNKKIAYKKLSKRI